MTDPDIINMARAAGWDEYTLSAIVGTEQMDRLQAFARLIAEDCAKRCDQFQSEYSSGSIGVRWAAKSCAAAIREAYKP